LFFSQRDLAKRLMNAQWPASDDHGRSRSMATWHAGRAGINIIRARGAPCPRAHDAPAASGTSGAGSTCRRPVFGLDVCSGAALVFACLVVCSSDLDMQRAACQTRLTSAYAAAWLDSVIQMGHARLAVAHLSLKSCIALAGSNSSCSSMQIRKGQRSLVLIF